MDENIDSITTPGLIIAGNECLSSPQQVRDFYMQNNYQPVFIGETGPKKICDSLIYLVSQSYFEGLNPGYYHFAVADSLLNNCNTKLSFSTAFYLEIMLTDAFLSYTSDLYAGHIHLNNENVEWKEHISGVNLVDSLNKAINTGRLSEIVNNLSCRHTGYAALKKTLHKYIFSCHKVDTGTCEDSLLIIASNMERWRWLPHDLIQPCIMVNIAGFNMDVADSDKIVMSMKIIVGKTYTRTPLFHAKMTYLILNPYWEIPASIAGKEILPEARKNRDYFVRNHIKIYENWNPDANEIVPDSINWDSIPPGKLTYHFRQSPGKWNALGRIKFMLPNKYNVYLHDTPQPELFLKSTRDFSHGCIRIEKPLELALYLLNKGSTWNMEKLTAILDSVSDKVVVLPKPINVYICYWTAWADSTGKVNFRPDIYDYDRRLESAMQPTYRLRKK